MTLTNIQCSMKTGIKQSPWLVPAKFTFGVHWIHRFTFRPTHQLHVISQLQIWTSLFKFYTPQIWRRTLSRSLGRWLYSLQIHVSLTEGHDTKAHDGHHSCNLSACATNAAKTPITLYILSQLDYCNRLLMGTPNSLQKVQNSATRLILMASHHNSTPLQ